MTAQQLAGLPTLRMTLLVLFVAGCAPLPQYTSVYVEQRPSPNFSERRPNMVILHHTGNSDAQRALSTLADPAGEVSAHFLIARDGKIYYLVDELKRAWHAGASYWGGNRDLNSASIGIELDNNGEEPFAEPQIETLLVLLADLKERYKLPSANFLGHGDVAPGRKTDPSRWFPWQRLAGHGFGLWCEPPYHAVPDGLDDTALLQAFGYDAWRLDAAVAAFKRRFAPDDPLPEMTEHDRAVLYCLILKKQIGE